ncbi:uncharacterized protein LOC121426859 [Lytechinus variegatus]|uniref:uncharacterized protein LOC121426859 n=1 Tax=Lytechinus variegatus TaxID=7654 RepID=UPI001BB20950|nr:uncharacterized protein LOC121426859 [Lytechinus variegatus]
MASTISRKTSSKKRQNDCTNRPLYRDGRRGTAVKVFTINQESRYLLVHGVPDINVTDELLKLLSLYGKIEEYRTLDESDAEEFTKTHWIKYADISAARVAKRKMDDSSFYGGFLHVTYAPEYETIDDTRKKLQQRRMDIARRLRKLAQERASDEAGSLEIVEASSSTLDTRDRQLDRPSPVTAWMPTPAQEAQSSASSDPPRAAAGGGVDARYGHGHSGNELGNPDQQNEQIPPSLPEPPRRLPPWQWDIPSQPEFPRLRTKHDTLPDGFNPFPDGGGKLNQDKMGPTHQLPSSISAAPSSAFIGPLCPTVGGSVNPALDPDSQCSLLHGQSFRDPGARPKQRSIPSHSGGHLESADHQQTDHQHGQVVGGTDGAQTGQVQGPGSHAGCAGAEYSQIDQRPKLVGRRRLGSNTSGSPDKQAHVAQSKTPCASGLSSQPVFFPRVVSTRTKRSASSIEEDDQQSDHQSSPATGDTSFDRTVSSVRQQMSQVSQAVVSSTGPTSTIQRILIQTRNQERMGLLPRRPPTKRQRI